MSMAKVIPICRRVNGSMERAIGRDQWRREKAGGSTNTQNGIHARTHQAVDPRTFYDKRVRARPRADLERRAALAGILRI